MNKLKLKFKNYSLTVKIVFNLQNHLTFHSAEWLVNLVGGRECFVGLSIFLVYGCENLLVVAGVVDALVVVAVVFVVVVWGFPPYITYYAINILIFLITNIFSLSYFTAGEGWVGLPMTRALTPKM